MVKPGNWFAIAFGKGMYDVDMILWHNVVGSPKATDLWSTGEYTPETDAQQNLQTTTQTLGDGSVEFTTKRAFDTGDRDQDFLISMDQDLMLSYAYLNSGSG